jgi:hypothetical protein
MASPRTKQFSVKDAVGSYLPLMHELASRLDLIGRFCKRDYDIPFPYAREFIYLQLRQVCELIALGCLQLHGDLPVASSKTSKAEWNAGKIMHLLSKHHSHCFPMCVKTSAGMDGFTITASHNPDALTFDEYNSLYHECGMFLHRGSIRAIEAAGPLSECDLENLVRWHRKLIALLNEHIVGRSSHISFYLTSLRTEAGFPQCSVITKSTANGMAVETYTMSITESGYEEVILAGNMKSVSP